MTEAQISEFQTLAEGIVEKANKLKARTMGEKPVPFEIITSKREIQKDLEKMDLLYAYVVRAAS